MSKWKSKKWTITVITLVIVAVFVCFFVIFHDNVFSNVNSNTKAKASIILKGDKSLTLEMGNGYSEKGFKAVDSKGNNISDKVEITGSVDINKPGTYKITYTITGSNNNKITEVREVKVIDTIKPTITFETNGNNTAKQTHQTKVTVTDSGGVDLSSLKYLWSNTENVPKEENFSLKFDNDTVIKQTEVKGIYYLWIIAKDKEGNTSIVRSNSFNFNYTSNPSIPNNNIPTSKTSIPEVTLLGSNQVTIEVGSNYHDAGAIADDETDGSLVPVVTSNLNTNVTGTYHVTYTITNSFGKQTSKTRIVNVVDTTKPVITLLGDSEVTISVGGSYNDSGATANDNYDGNITDKIVIDNPVNLNVIGTYAITYSVTDSSGNHAVEVTRTVNVVDTTKPVITLLENSEVTIEVGSDYHDAGATSSDNYEGDITQNIVTTGNVNPGILGVYTISYNVSDSSGNHAVEVTRTVNVVDTTKPVITLLGDSEITLSVGGSYDDLGATASDNYDGNITNEIITVNSVDASEVGTYTVTYNVSDSSGNQAFEITRTINVVTSTLNWVTHTVGTSDYYCVYYANGRWVTVGTSGAIATSTDGETWTAKTVGSGNYYNAYNNGSRWVAVGEQGVIATSTDGVTWATQTVGAYSNYYYSVYYANGRWVAVGDNGARDDSLYKGIIATSTDGVTWTAQTVESVASYSNVYYANGRWIAVGGTNADYSNNGVISTSTDGETWTTQTVGTDNVYYSGVYYADGRWVTVGNGVIVTSTDGVAWTTQIISEYDNYYSVYYANGRWVTASNGGVISTSTDGLTWTAQIMGSNIMYFNVSNHGGRWLAIGNGGYNGIISTSVDGETWTTEQVGIGMNYSSFSNNSTLVVVGSAGTIITSTLSR